MKDSTFLKALGAIAAATAVILACSPEPAKASEMAFGLHLFSHHNPNDGWCNFNPGAYGRKGGWVAGFYRNSECKRWSFYGARHWETEGRVRLGLSAGLVTGYEAAPMLPLLYPSIAIDFWGTTWRLGGIPKIHPKQDAGVLHLSTEWRF